MCIGIAIKKGPDHPLILSAIETRLFSEEINAALGKRNRHLLRIFPINQLAGRREKILYDIQSAERLICVFYWFFHTSVDLESNTLHQKCELHLVDK